MTSEYYPQTRTVERGGSSVGVFISSLALAGVLVSGCEAQQSDQPQIVRQSPPGACVTQIDLYHNTKLYSDPVDSLDDTSHILTTIDATNSPYYDQRSRFLSVATPNGIQISGSWYGVNFADLKPSLRGYQAQTVEQTDTDKIIWTNANTQNGALLGYLDDCTK